MGRHDSPVARVVKILPANAGHKKFGFDLCVGKIPWGRAWQPTPVFSCLENPTDVEPGRLQSIGSQRVGHD